jgi:hypothetical protein
LNGDEKLTFSPGQQLAIWPMIADSAYLKEKGDWCHPVGFHYLGEMETKAANENAWDRGRVSQAMGGQRAALKVKTGGQTYS